MSATGRPEEEDSERPLRRSAEETRGIAIVLTDPQVEDVLRGVAGRDGLHGFLLGHVDDLERLRASATMRDPLLEDDPKLSKSLLRALLILRALMPAGTERGVVDIAGELGISPGTAHRYINTLKKVGLLEQSTATRAYRLATGGREYDAAR